MTGFQLDLKGKTLIVYKGWPHWDDTNFRREIAKTVFRNHLQWSGLISDLHSVITNKNEFYLLNYFMSNPTLQLFGKCTRDLIYYDRFI